MFTYLLLLSLLFVTSQQYAIDNDVNKKIKKYHIHLLGENNNKSDVRLTIELPELEKIGDNESREVYWYEQTVAVRDFKNSNNLTRRCEILEIYETEKTIDILGNWTSLGKVEIKNVTMEKMRGVMDNCDALDDDKRKIDIEFNEEEGAKEIQKEEEKDDKSRAIFSGIVPGTKWCGFGDIADRYHDLGKLKNTDRCCRAHDLCPIKVLSKDMRYNLTNEAIYTKSHCLCDEIFYYCLKEVDGWMSDILGYIYFKTVSPECIIGLPNMPNENMEFVPAMNRWN